jgi:predicted TIM-barrel fold metal-dependent hydrolase
MPDAAREGLAQHQYVTKERRVNAPVSEKPMGTVFQVVPRHEEMTLLPDPERREARFPLISVDDHIIETPDVFTARVPARLRDRVPHVQEENGLPIWRIGPHRQPIVAGNALVGRPAGEWHFYDALRYEEMRKGAWDAAAFVADMDINGTTASLGFPSSTFGFAGQMFFELKDNEAAIAAIDARNDWIFEEWYTPFPSRFIPMQIVWMGDVEVAAAQVRRNAARGFKAVSFSECPERLGLPSIHSGYWEPFFAACAETDTVINLHIGSSSFTVGVSKDIAGINSLFFPLSGMISAGDWLFSRVSVRYPSLKVVLAESGIGWVPMLMDRLEHMGRHGMDAPDTRELWRALGDPVEALQRNFYFTTFEDPTSFRVLDRIGEDNVMLEVDYPHPDSSWPNTHELLEPQLAGLSRDVIHKLAYDNAARVYRYGA